MSARALERAFFFAVAWSMLSPRLLARKFFSSVKNSGPEHSTFTSVSPLGGFAASAAFFLLLQAPSPPISIRPMKAMDATLVVVVLIVFVLGGCCFVILPMACQSAQQGLTGAAGR